MDFNHKKIINYFFRGLLFVAPLVITFYILTLIVLFLDSLIPLPIPGLGMLIVFGFITFIGYAASMFLTRPLFDMLEGWLIKIPLVNIIYTSIKDLMSAFVGDKKKFNTPIVVKMSENLYRLGFMTQEDMGALDEPGLAAVYFPHSYNFSGNSYLVPRENVRVLKNVNSAEVMKFIVSGGVSDLTVLEKLH
ncbi:MAG TPA: DUF502 domain-containing protein [Cyclobacteriaceae bacterium]|nr:DUF502 domain-containing protein [Cyclobacteriaceae bacterium]